MIGDELKELSRGLFDAYDLDGNGSISVHEQLLVAELSELYDAEPEDVSSFLSKAFTIVDTQV